MSDIYTPAEFVAACEAEGFTWSAHGTTVTVRTSFQPGDNAGFVNADGTGPMLLAGVPTTSSGSTWGTDGGGVGGMVAISKGQYRLNKSGCSKRFVNALNKFGA